MTPEGFSADCSPAIWPGRRPGRAWGWLLFAALFALAPLFAVRPAAAAPAEPTTPTVWSWSSYKQDATTAAYPNTAAGASQVTTQIESLPGTPTDPIDVWTTDIYPGAAGETSEVLGTQIPGFLLGDIGGIEPPSGTNIFRDTKDIFWQSPLYGINGVGSVATTEVTVDNDDDTNGAPPAMVTPSSYFPLTAAFTDSSVVPGSDTDAHTSAISGQTGYDYATNAGVGNAATATADFTVTVPYAGDWSFYEWHPVAGGEGHVHDAHFTLEVNGAGVIPSNGTSLAITGATNASPIVITTAVANMLATGQSVVIAGVGGNTAANGTWTVTVLSSTTVSLNGSTGNGAYTAGGTLASAIQTVDQTVNGGSWVLVAGPYTLPASSGTNVITVHVDNSTNDTTASPLTAVITADAVQLRPDGLIVDNPQSLPDPTVINQAAVAGPPAIPAENWSLQATSAEVPDNYGANYLRIQPAPRGAAGLTAGTVTYTPNVSAGGLYSVYAWFPSQYTGSPGTELHIDDAEYTINTNGGTFTADVNEQSGGGWVYVGGPYYFPEGDNSTIVIDNTTNDNVFTQGTPGGVTTITPNANVYVVANAIELVSSGEVSSLYGSPVSVCNFSYPPGTTPPAYNGTEPTGGDYPELFNGYSAYDNSTDELGGLFPQYFAPHVNSDKSTTANLLDYFGGNLYQNNPITTGPNAGATEFPLQDLVYFTRTEQVSISGGGTETEGAIYCVDGLNGNVVWRYPNQGDVVRISGAPTAGTFTLAFGGYITAPINYNDPASTVQTDLASLASVGSGNVTVYGQNGGPFEVNFVGALAGTTTALTVGTSAITGGTAYVTDAPGQTSLPGSISSTPLVLRNIVVRCNPASEPGDHYDVRTVIVAGDNNGKLFCLDAAGNGDGDDTVVDATGAPVAFDSTGQPVGTATAPLSLRVPGTTTCYWVWQPNSSMPLAQTQSTYIVDDNLQVNTALGNPNGFTSVGFATAYYTDTDAYPDIVTESQLGLPDTDRTYMRDVPTTTDYCAWAPNIPATASAQSCTVSVWYPSPTNEAHAEVTYTVLDNGSNPIVSDPVDQSQNGGQWVLLTKGGVPLTATFDGTGSAGFTKNCVVLTDSVVSGTGDVVGNAVMVQSATPFKSVAPNNDLIPPSAYHLNSATASLSQLIENGSPVQYTTGEYAGSYIYTATLFVGNSNGVLYSVDARGTLNNPPIYNATTGAVTSSAPYTATNTKTFDLSVDPTVPTVAVNWWANFGYNGAGIAYAPAYDANNNRVYVTTYDTNDNNIGRVYAVNAETGPIGDGGFDYNSSTGTFLGPGSFQYNINPIPVWSFPDGYGNVTDAVGAPLNGVTYTPPAANVPIGTPVNPVPPVTLLIDNSQVNGGANPAMPLGDIAGAPTLYTYLDTTGGLPGVNRTELIVCANDPNSTVTGRMYVIGVDSAVGQTPGQFYWSYPNTHLSGGAPLDPNIVGNVTTQQAVFAANNDTNGNAITSGAFTEELTDPDLFVSSSAACAVITFPSLPAGSTGTTGTFASLGDTAVPMAYFGNLDGILTAVDLNTTPATSDDNRLVYNEPIGDGEPILSTPAVLGGSSLDSSGTPIVSDVGGTVWLTSGSGDLWEYEATPYVSSLSGAPETLVNADAEFEGVGALSSPALGAFNAIGFFEAGSPPSDGTPVINSSDLEYVYCGSDSGAMWGFTGQVYLSGAGGGGGWLNPETMLPFQPEPPSSNPLVSLATNFVTAVGTQTSTAPPYALSASNIFTPLKSDVNPVFDWGQTLDAVIYGLADPNGTGVTNYNVTPPVSDPKLISLTFTFTTVGAQGNVTRIETRSIPLSDVYPYPGYPANPTAFQTDLAALPGTAGSGLAGAANGQDMGEFEGVYPYVLGNGDGNQQTPGTKVLISNVTETVMLNGQTQTYQSRIDTGTLLRNSSGNLVQTQPVDQATFGILNPLAIRGAGLALSGYSGSASVENLTLGVPGGPTAGELGPFVGFDVTTQPAWPDYQMAASNGNDVPTTAPLAGTISVGAPPGATGFNPTAIASSQTATPVFSPIVVATSAGIVENGSSGDNGALTVPTEGVNPAQNNNPTSVTPTPSTDYGRTLFNVADRSALGVNGNGMDRIRMDSTSLGWNDNSGENGPGAVINPMPWESMPQSYALGSNLGNPDYPDIPRGNTTVEIEPLQPASNQGTSLGGSGAITSTPEALANTSSNTGYRYVNPQAVLVTVDVPQYQPANLEGYNPSSGTIYPGDSHLSSSLNPSVDVPNGYVALQHVFVDSYGTGKFTRNDAYRDVQVWVNVPVTFSTQISQPTIDVGTVPAGFGIENPADGSNDSANWSPFTATGAPSVYAQWFQPLTVYNLSNVNLYNVHFDQAVASGSTDGSGNTLPGYLPLEADAVGADSFIPGLDLLPGGGETGILTASGTGGTAPTPLVRTSIDDFDPSATYSSSALTWGGGTSTGNWGPNAPINNVEPWFNTYRPNTNLLTGGAFDWTLRGNHPAGPSAHKPRVLDDPSTGDTMEAPDEPHDLGAPYTDTSSVADSPTRQPASPTISVAVPIGTPVGTYYQTVRAFEGYDLPYSPYKGPTYSQGNNALTVINGNPQQPVSDPGTVVKVTVDESRATKGDPMKAGATSISGSGTSTFTAAAPNIDSTDSGAPWANELNPWVFSDPTSGSLAVLWQSGRNQSNATFNPAQPFYDIYGSGLQTTVANGTANGSSTTSAMFGWGTVMNTQRSGGGFWFSSPTSLTTGLAYDGNPIPPTSGATVGAGTSYDPSVITGSPDEALWAFTEFNTATSGSPVTTFGLEVGPFTVSGSGAVAASGSATALLTSSTPIYHPRGVFFTFSGNPYYVIFWTTRSGGRNAIDYAIYPSGGSTPVTPYVLPTPAGLSEVQEPIPVLRSISYGSGNEPIIDLTYSGKSEVTGTTDIYTSRYVVNPTASISAVTLITFGPSVTDTLTSDAQQAVWKGQDVAWTRDLNNFTLVSSTAGVLIEAGDPEVPSPPSPQPTSVDTATGVMTYSVQVADPGDPTVTYTVRVDPRSGVVTFSPAPPPVVPGQPIPAGAIGTLSATVAVQAVRISSGSMSSSQPSVFIDEANKFNDAQSSGFLPVPASRYWYVYRKASSGAGNAAAISSTLYYNTRRLTVVLPAPIALNAAGQVDSTSFTVSLFTDRDGHNAYGGSVPPVDVDWKRNRVYFPDSCDGLYAQITYAASYSGGSATTTTTPITLVQWMDEPYVNSPTDENEHGERAVPISNAVNESAPSVVLDPASATTTSVGGAQVPVNPHRVWLFWSSTRNTGTYRGVVGALTPGAINVGDYVALSSNPNNPQYYVALVAGANPANAPGPGWEPYFGASDLYYEALNPRFDVTSP